MTTTTASSASQIQSQWAAASPGDIIEIAPGDYGKATLAARTFNSADTYGTAMQAFFDDLLDYVTDQRAAPGSNLTAPEFEPSLSTVFANNVTLRPQDRDDPPRWRGDALEFDNSDGVTLDGLLFHGDQVESTKGGVQYPANSSIVAVADCKNVWVRDWTWRFHLDQFVLARSENVVLERNQWVQCGRDSIQAYSATDNLLIRRNVDETRIDASRISEADRHPDSFQHRNSNSQGWIASVNVLVEDNYINRNYAQTIYVKDPRVDGDSPAYTGPQGDVNTYGYKSICHRRNDITAGRVHCITLQGTVKALVEGNRIRTIASNKETPRICLWGWNVNTLLKNNVQPISYGLSNGDTASANGKVRINEVVSTTAKPSGFEDLTPGVNVGPYTEGAEPTPTKPETLDEEWANPPTNTVGKDGRIASVVEVLERPGRYTGIAIVSTASPAFAAAADPTTFRWTRAGISGTRGFRTANPATNASGARRLEMIGAPGDADSVWSCAANGTMTGITLAWSVSGVWSDPTPYTGSFTAPPSPPPPDPIMALADKTWGFIGAVFAFPGLEGRFSKQFQFVSGVAPAAITGVEWCINGETTWRPVQIVGSDAGGDIYELRPLAGGVEHTAAYGATLTIRLRHSINEVFGPQSATAKSFTGPAAPAPIGTFDPGDRLTTSGNTISIGGGFPLAIPPANRPAAMLATSVSVNVDEDSDTVTVTMFTTPPAGAVDQFVLYAGRAWIVDRVTGEVSFPRIAGQKWLYAGAVDAADARSPLLYFPVPGA